MIDQGKIMIDSEITSLNDLRMNRTAPELDSKQEQILKKELFKYMDNADWFTVGIMSPTYQLAINVLKEMESQFNWPPLKVASHPNDEGPVFLKANQRTGVFHARIEYGLGEGILLSCQYNVEDKDAKTLGPLPLDFFRIKD